MSTLAVEWPCAPPSCDADQLVRKRVLAILRASQLQQQVAVERRKDRREPYPYPIHVTPVGADGAIEKNDTFVVLGKHLSERGLDFYCEAPVPHRRVITSWKDSNGKWLALLLDLRWCRSNEHGWYENGGRFLRVVNSPQETDGMTPPSNDSRTE